MPKPSQVTAYGDVPVEPYRDQRRWTASYGTQIAGRAYFDGADQTAAEMEAKWGCGRLRLLVDPELREKFDRQRYKLNQAIWHGELEDVRQQASRMVKAWLALDKAATAAGKATLDPQVWEIVLADGRVAAIVQDNTQAHRVIGEGRKVAVYTLEDIGRLLSESPIMNSAKIVFPGATVTAVRRSVGDPLDGVHDTAGDIDDVIPF